MFKLKVNVENNNTNTVEQKNRMLCYKNPTYCISAQKCLMCTMDERALKAQRATGHITDGHGMQMNLVGKI